MAGVEYPDLSAGSFADDRRDIAIAEILPKHHRNFIFRHIIDEISYRFRPRFRICGATAVSRLVFQSEFFYKVKQRKTISEYDGLSLCIIYNILK